MAEHSLDKKLNYITIPIKTGYIKPGEPYKTIIHGAADLIEDGDFLVISETPISVSQGRLVDEAEFEPSIMSILLADLWSKYLWGYILGPIFRIKKRTIHNLRKLPPEARSHKRVILEYYGLKHALKPASEAGVDLSNVPGTFVSLLPDKPELVAMDIEDELLKSTGRRVTVMIIDTDASYELFGKKFTSLPIAVSGIKCNMGFFGYILGRFGSIIGPTPLGISKRHDLDKIIEIAKITEEYHEKNEMDMETVYDMSSTFDGDITDITVDMLDSVEHTPAVIVRIL
ncbi:coenzyme F420-0:L-glutamate ligase [Methanobacterium aggregans]|uniref:coenzyme F420-0:L-glutamate ligase n=1 Tax=Methanobacterium aggregans TaxID=1615586 RepID=UPI00315B0DF9|nr:F420-0:gamma-glutamyl ligase-like protein [Methanobacterium aggregans]